MSNKTMRTHIIVPKELVDSVDALVGPRGRSKFFTEAVEEKLARTRLIEAAKKAVGSLKDTDIPGWETSKSAAEWVRASRKTDEDGLTRLLEET